MSFYAKYPVEGGAQQIVEYPSSASFPVSASPGDFALALDTGILYEYYMGAWTPIAGPGFVLSIGTYDLQTPVANGLQIVADQLYAQSATASFPGMVNTGSQTFAGVKNFNSNIFAANLSGTNSGDVTIGTANGLSLAGQALSLALSSTSTTGALSSTDWNTFNNKQPTLTIGNLTDVGTDGIVITGGTGAVIGTGTSIAQHVADTTHNGYLSSTDWNTFNGKGTVTAVSVVSTNGFAGSSSGGATPALTLSTTITGVLKGNATAISAATAGTDYSLGTSALTTGILKSTTSTGALTIAVAGDFPTLNQNTTGTAANITATSNSTITTLTALSLPTTQLTGTLQAAQEPAHTGDVTNTAGSLALSLVATSNATLTSLSAAAGVTIHGTNTNNNAASGFIGEYISANPGGNVTPGASAAKTNLTSISLTAGDWDVEGLFALLPSGGSAVTSLSGGVSLTTAAFDSSALGGFTAFFSTAAFPNGGAMYFSTGNRRISISTTTTVFFVGSISYTILGTTVYSSECYLRARRVR